MSGFAFAAKRREGERQTSSAFDAGWRSRYHSVCLSHRAPLSDPYLTAAHPITYKKGWSVEREGKLRATYVMNSAFIIAVASWSPFVRSRKNESISSIKMMQGCAFRARLNSPATSLFDSPNHLFVRTEIATLMNVAPDSLARAFASIVFPHPGGPKSRTPLGAPARMEELLKRLGYRRGYMIVSRSEEMIWSKPPISITGRLGEGNECSRVGLA